MGNLHQGHLSLVALARASGLPVAASIFINRLQFGPTDDFDRYPRTLDADCDLLEKAGCELVFAPSEAELYPQPQRFQVHPDPTLADILEGHFRPGFFVGVCTVVMKLFCCIQPQVAVFGKKDYQQWLLIRRMVEQFALPIEVQAGETRRGSDGLALSSRNAFLDADQRIRAAELARALDTLVEDYRRGAAPLPELEARSMAALAASGWQPDYLTIRRRSDLAVPPLGEAVGSNPGAPAAPAAQVAPAALVALGAARLGATRLIDNVEF
jgi:pantoate--beta-alanine ligase